MNRNHVNELTRFEMKDRIADGAFAILPVGACEQHGTHLPLGTDVFLAEYVSEKIAERVDAVIFPSYNFGYSWVWKDLPGTLTLSQETFKAVLFELIESMIGQGFTKILVVNGHDSNNKAIRYVLRDVYDRYPQITVLGIFYPGMNEIYKAVMESPTWGGMFHADEWETSLMLSAKENLVHMDRAVSEYPEKPLTYGLDASSLSSISKSGIYGDPTKATKEKGDRIIEMVTEKIVGILNELK